MHLVGSIIRIYHDERSPERQIFLIIVILYHSYHYGGNSLNLFSNSNDKFSKCLLWPKTGSNVTNLQIIFPKLT